MPNPLEAPGGTLKQNWNRLSKYPFGRTVFSIMVGRMVPYTASIGARVEELSPGYARWTMRDRPRVRNHLKSVHAVALVNFAEITSGTAMMMTLPLNIRGIVRAISIEYLKKARGTLTAECRCTVPAVTAALNHDIHAEIRDAAGDVVARATVTWRLTPVSDASRSVLPETSTVSAARS